ncbi:tRNA (guanosine(46)-N7)-methyltransferase TrmB [filamentous cyanobacterium LEGE 11480]|uniref:tRNA (guanine-N(7)-)-methyltransferase n=1 Tax=Romeriopsis navalis LEGE 11480 TaxID=2777977 RepID=A0A928VU76_9CYAN|nr:tRNA (guanosine(46)-N7)-methyltransferase TrmB [Romeriopsis navalis]MBE9032665.1 tRNA (guanosine(46)-N7)-methyltransferase TrmB [Romeriopsis navalis LEGE 11480]
MALVRVREHVNPLANRYKAVRPMPDWSTIYADLSQPLHIDIGCARGRFVHQLATQQPDWNYLGLEIREPLVLQANEWRDAAQLENLHYLFCNANIMLRTVLASLPSAVLQCVSIQFPDPWFKKKHHKRRVVQPPLVQDLADYLPAGAQIFIQSDILDVAAEMRDRFTANAAFQPQSTDWLAENPMPLPTEREIGVLNNQDPVYRVLFTRV